MTTLTVEIDKEQDLTTIISELNKLGVKYQISEEDKDEWGDLPEAAIEGIKAGLADTDAGRVHTHEEVLQRIQNKLDSWRRKNG